VLLPEACSFALECTMAEETTTGTRLANLAQPAQRAIGSGKKMGPACDAGPRTMI
jgi:hypothetical protein